MELYRNGEMLGYQRASGGGYYSFSDISLYPGENKFTLIFYGPQGQIRREEKPIYYRGNVLSKGEAVFRAYAVEQNKNMAGTGFKYPSYLTGVSALAEGAYGVTENITLRAAAVQEPVSVFGETEYHKKNKTFAYAGVSAMINPFYVNIESLYDFERNSATLGTSLQTKVYGFSVDLENNYFNDAVMTKNVYNNKIIKNTASAEINKTINVFKLFDLPFTALYKNTLDHADRSQNEFYFSLYQNLFFNVYGGASYRYTDGFEDNKREDITFYFSKFYKGATLRLDADYNMDYEKFSDISASLQFALTEKTDLSLRYEREAADYSSSSYLNRYEGGINFKSKFGYFNVNAGYVSDRSFYVTSGYSISFGYDPKGKNVLYSDDKFYDTGMAAVNVFVDKNKNGVFDGGDKVIENPQAAIYPQQYTEDWEYSKNGYTYFPYLKKYMTYEISLDIDGLDETYALPGGENKKYMRVRPGEIVHIDYPLLESAFIEGGVTFADGLSGKKSPLKGIKLNLVDVKNNRTVASALSEYDGYYSFEKVPLGFYKVVPEENQMKALNYTYNSCSGVDLNMEEEVFVCDISAEEKR